MIQLVSVVKYEFVTKYGIDEILKPFVQDLSVLENISFQVHVPACTLCLCMTNVHYIVLHMYFLYIKHL